MLVYGDQARDVDPRVEVDTLRARAAALAETPAGWRRHEALVRLFIAAAGWMQGVADAAFRAAGDRDGIDTLQDAWTAGLCDLAGAIDRSWSSNFADQPCPVLPDVEAYALPERIAVRRAEGYAFYALHPELYLAAARVLPADSVVIGLRSIGTGLAALVATASKAALVRTVRPVGPPFARTLALAPPLEAEFAAHRARTFALVDEGPGLSGSSLGGAADTLEALGVAPARIRFLPSHDGDLGSQASAAHRARWQTAHRHVARFEDGVLPRLADWFADLTGPATEPLRDLGGGAWRALSPDPHAPVDPGREARKYALVTREGRFLLKFVGLDDTAAAKMGRAERLHAGGFVPQPLALRNGFLLERWIDSDRPAEAADIVPALPDYLAFRARELPADRIGASLSALVAMARYNLADVPGVERLFAKVDADGLQAAVRPVHVDARLHRWEWIAGADGALKTDAIDHSQAHDLVGPQDIAWDVAGALAEYEAADAAALIAAAMPGRAEAAALVACLLPCYLAFQRGWWSYAPDGAAQAERYAAKATVLATLR